MLNQSLQTFAYKMQKNELNASILYSRLSGMLRDPGEKQKLANIADDEKRHAGYFGRFSGRKAHPNRVMIFFSLILCRVLGYTFYIKFLEGTEARGEAAYAKNLALLPDLQSVLDDEERHEQVLIGMLDEERLRYVGDMVLGMNDALVELTGSLAGYTLALQNTRTIAMAGLITGIAATLSMMSSSYLSSRASGAPDAMKSGAYTGAAYVITVVLLILPYLLLPASAYIGALLVALAITVAIIAAFNFYVSIAQEKPFRRDFLTMVSISLGVAGISFIVGLLVKQVLGINL